MGRAGRDDEPANRVRNDLGSLVRPPLGGDGPRLRGGYGKGAGFEVGRGDDEVVRLYWHRWQ